MKRGIAVVALALLTVTSGCIGSGLTDTGTNVQSVGDAPTRNAPDSDRTVTVSASGRIQTAPERAVVRVSVTARADSAETVRQQMAENASQLRTALEKAGLDSDQIATAQYDINQNHRREEDPSEPEYRGRHAFIVTVNETDRAGEIVVTAVENGATRIEDVRFTITQETRNDLRKKALAKAIRNARGKAMVAANETGLELTGINTVQTGAVSTQSVKRDTVYETAATNGGGSGVSTSFEGGRVTVAADVVVVYNATSS